MEQQDSGLTVHANTAGDVLNILRRYSGKKKQVWIPRGLIRKSSQIFLLGLSPKVFFFSLFSFFIHAGKLIRACAVFLNNILIHIHTVTLAHTWELQSTTAGGRGGRGGGGGRGLALSHGPTFPRQEGEDPGVQQLWVAGVKTQ